MNNDKKDKNRSYKNIPKEKWGEKEIWDYYQTDDFFWSKDDKISIEELAAYVDNELSKDERNKFMKNLHAASMNGTLSHYIKKLYQFKSSSDLLRNKLNFNVSNKEKDWLIKNIDTYVESVEKAESVTGGDIIILDKVRKNLPKASDLYKIAAGFLVCAILVQTPLMDAYSPPSDSIVSPRSDSVFMRGVDIPSFALDTPLTLIDISTNDIINNGEIIYKLKQYRIKFQSPMNGTLSLNYIEGENINKNIIKNLEVEKDNIYFLPNNESTFEISTSQELINFRVIIKTEDGFFERYYSFGIR